MKKKQQEITLKQLEERQKAFQTVGKLLIILCIVYGIFTMIRIVINNGKNISYLPIIILIVLYVAILVSYKISIKLIVRIEKKKEEIRISTIKELAKGGELKEFVKIKDKQIIRNILAKNIKKITIEDIEKSNFTTSIQLGDATFQSNIPIEKLISLLDENSKEQMLGHLINNIKIENIQGTTVLEIDAQNFLCTNSKTTEKELLQIFDLKEE